VPVYSEKVMEHFKNPRNVGIIEKPDAIGHAETAFCGCVMDLYIKVDKDIITEAKFKTRGCGAAIASSSAVTEMVKMKSLKEASEISNQMVAEALGGLPPVKLVCAIPAEDALKSAINNYLLKNIKTR
jgi:nitrogen fixation protein NifU and related proteins